jgi:hypothetical protein
VCAHFYSIFVAKSILKDKASNSVPTSLRKALMKSDFIAVKKSHIKNHIKSSGHHQGIFEENVKTFFLQKRLK